MTAPIALSRRSHRAARAIGALRALTVALVAVTASLGDDAAPKATDAAPRVRVFILAGQSNMQGQAVVDLVHERYYNGGRGTLIRLLDDPEKGSAVRHLRGKDGEWTVRDDVFVRYRTEEEVKTGKLGLGFTGYEGKHHFGPELQFGHVVGDAIDAPVLLIKCAWGGKSLHRDFRPTSAGGETGPYYTKMLVEIREALAAAPKEFPALAGRELAISGFVWFQGWNDMIDRDATAEYASNLAHLIRDVRRELAVRDLPVVVGETGNCDSEALRAAQASVAKLEEFAGSVAFVGTRDFLRKAEDSPNTGHGHHWFGNAESYFLIGDAFGRAMLGLLDGRSSAE